MDMSAGSLHKDKKAWRYVFLYNSRRFQRGGFSTRAAASKAMQGKKDEIVAHGGEVKKIGFNDSYSEYLDDMKHENKYDWWRTKKIFYKHYSKHFCDDLVHTICDFDLNKYKYSRKASKTVSTSTIDKELAVLKHFFSWAIKKGYCRNNPATEVKKFNDDNRRGIAISRGNAKNLLDLSDNEMKARILLALGYGLRHGEITGIQMRDVDTLNNTIKIQREKKRKRTSEILHVPNDLMKLLLALPHGRGKRSGYLFATDKCYKRWKRLLINAGLDTEIRFHDLRHTAGTWQLEDGANLEAIRRFLGHENVTTTARYLHADDDVVQSMSAKTLKGLI